MIKTDLGDLLDAKKKKKKKKKKHQDIELTAGEVKKKERKVKKALELRGKVDYSIHITTSNPSFLKMYRHLKALGIKNNKFFLKLYDTDLENVDPFDEDLSMETKTKIIIECSKNYWYFIRECVRVPVSGSGIGIGKGKKYNLHRGTLALSYALINNINSYTELPRQSGKSISVDICLLWLLNFGTNTTKMMMMNKDHNNAKENIMRIKEIRECLPKYLQGSMIFNEEKKAIKGSDNKEFIECKATNNRIDTKASPTNEGAADNAGYIIAPYNGNIICKNFFNCGEILIA